MKGLNEVATFDWLEFKDPASDEKWRVPLTFMLSNWSCMYGNGCPGHVPAGSDKTFPDIGCCTIGTQMDDPVQIDRVRKMADLLTDEDWDKRLRNIAEKKGIFKNIGPELVDFDGDGNMIEGSEHYEVGTRVVERGCIFANRSNGSTGKPGCAFAHMANRKGLDHIDTMPPACFQLPLGLRYDGPEQEINVVVPWDADYWRGRDDDGTHDSFMTWWCIDTPDAYTGAQPVYQSYRRELISMMGEAAYKLMAVLIEQRADNHRSIMPGQIVNEGRPLLPVLMEGKQPARCGKPRT